MFRKQIPNLLTLTNLLMGCISLYFIFTLQFTIVFWLIFIAAVADVFDGLVARWLKVDGGLGKQLDSLADMVSFGVVPGAILLQLIRYDYDAQYTFNSDQGLGWSFCGFIFTLGAALRLAIFTKDDEQSTDFIGLATPAATMVVIGLMLINQQGAGWLYDLTSDWTVLIGFAILLFALMLAPIRMFSLKSMVRGWKGNEIPILFSFVSLLAMIFYTAHALVILPLVYVILSWILSKQK